MTFNNYSSKELIKTKIDSVLWKDKKIGQSILGSIDAIYNIKHDDIKTTVQNIYTPDNATIIVIGDIEYYETNSIARRYFSEWNGVCQKDISCESLNCINKINDFNSVSRENISICLGFRAGGYLSQSRSYTKKSQRHKYFC